MNRHPGIGESSFLTEANSEWRIANPPYHIACNTPDERIDPAVRWRIVDTLSSLGDKTIISHLRALLPDEKIDSSVRWMVAEALEALAKERGERREDGEWRIENGEWRKPWAPWVTGPECLNSWRF